MRSADGRSLATAIRDMFPTKADRLFGGILLAIGAAISFWRYHSPFLLYGEVADDVYVFVHSDPATALLSALSNPDHALLFALFSILFPHDPAFLPDQYTGLFGWQVLPNITYMVVLLGAITFWIAPVAGFVAWKVSGSRMVGGLTAALMALSPQQNVAATQLNTYVVGQLPLLWMYYRAWVVDPRVRRSGDQFRGGMVTGLAAAVGILLVHYCWLAPIAVFPLLVIECLVRSRPFPGAIGYRIALRHAFGYAAGLGMGLFGALLVVELVYWVCIWGDLVGGLDSANSHGFFGKTFFQAKSFSSATWSAMRPAGYWTVIKQLIGWQGAFLLLLGLAWLGVRRWLCQGPSIPLSVAGVLLAGFAFICAPTLLPYGRFLLAFEFPAFLVISVLVKEVIFRPGRMARAMAWPAAALAVFMGVHMAFSTGVVREDVLNNGRAAEWVRAHPAPIYWTKGVYALSPTVSPADVAAMTDPHGYLIPSAVTDEEWVRTLKTLKTLPLQQWRTSKGAWNTFDSLGYKFLIHSPYPYAANTVIYDIAEVSRELKRLPH